MAMICAIFLPLPLPRLRSLPLPLPELLPQPEARLAARLMCELYIIQQYSEYEYECVCLC